MTDLEALSEEIERAALSSLHAHCPEETRQELGLELREVGDALVAGARNDPSILINRTLGLGTASAPTPDDIRQIAEIYRDIGATNFFLHLYTDDTPQEVLQSLSDNGLAPARGWMKFQRDDAPCRVAKTDLTVRRVGPEEAAPFGRIVATAFGMTEAAGPLLAGLANDPNWHLFVSYDGEMPAGAGGIYISGEAAFTEWGATDPAFRRRGSQGAIMEARINTALERGCKHIFTETGEAVAGDPQHSYGNIERFGFRELRLRQNFKPAP